MAHGLTVKEALRIGKHSHGNLPGLASCLTVYSLLLCGYGIGIDVCVALECIPWAAAG